MPVYVGLIATYDVYPPAQMMGVGLAISSGVAVHLWPTRTAPWRTIAWTWFLTALIGSTCLSLGMSRYALILTTIFGFTFVALRVNQNARKLWGMVKLWRALR